LLARDHTGLACHEETVIPDRGTRRGCGGWFLKIRSTLRLWTFLLWTWNYWHRHGVTAWRALGWCRQFFQRTNYIISCSQQQNCTSQRV